MSNGVIALGARSEQFLDQPTHVVHVEPATVVGRLDAAFELIADQLRVQRPLLVIYPRRLDPAARRTLSAVRSATDGAPVLWHASDLPPLALDVLVSLAAALAEPLGGTAAVAAGLGPLEAELRWATWLKSLSGLGQPAPTVMQHAQSALPGGSWLVTSWPSPTIHRFALDDLPVLPRHAETCGVALADADGRTDWVNPMAAGLVDPVGVRKDPPPASAEHYGSRAFTEVVVYPRDIPSLARRLWTQLDPGTCRWCRRHVGSSVCPWCGLPRNGMTRQDPDEARLIRSDVAATSSPPTPAEVSTA